jgi:hypothetical protein
VRGQLHRRHRGSRPVIAADHGLRGGRSGAPANPPHHVPVYWFPCHQDHREKMMASGQVAKEMAAWLTGPGCLIQPG